ncbi:MAG: NAD-dependent epimerase [Desulfobacterales bacterium]|nr:NAD-dependent epimerase [Desulfobacterales bacterium]
MHILITGVAGFIGFHLAKRLLDMEHSIYGIDNLNAYYDPQLKKNRLQMITDYPHFQFFLQDIASHESMKVFFEKQKLDCVIHLAAQAGVRYSLVNPHAYIESNILGFLNILEGCRFQSVPHLVYASSSSVYGLNTKLPLSVNDSVDHPVSLYAATKKSNELMAHTYSHLYQLPTTGLRFFTVYGPWGRPDMALFLFTKAIIENKPIQVFNNGNMKRDFTYIDDIVEGIIRVMSVIPTPKPISQIPALSPGLSPAPYRLYNIGNNQSVQLQYFIELIENYLGKKAIKEYLPMQPGDVQETFADIESLNKATGFQPKIRIEEGIKRFITWYKQYYA